MTRQQPVGMTMFTAAVIVDRLRANGFTMQDSARRQMLGLAEEAGEFVGAYRRWVGLARRGGTAKQVWAELADVVITAYVTAVEVNVHLDDSIPLPQVLPADPDRAVLGVFRAAHEAVKLFPVWPPDRVALRRVVSAAQQAAAVLDIDLPAAIAAKLDVIFTRGWRESAADGEPDTVPCGFGCGYLADSEADLDAHEAGCDTPCPPPAVDVPQPRKARRVR